MIWIKKDDLIIKFKLQNFSEIFHIIFLGIQKYFKLWNQISQTLNNSKLLSNTLLSISATEIEEAAHHFYHKPCKLLV